MKPGCSVCNAEETSPATIVDKSGGAFVRLCQDCMNDLAERRCRNCGQPEGEWSRGREGTIYGQDTDLAAVVCPDCRWDLIENTADVSEVGQDASAI